MEHGRAGGMAGGRLDLCGSRGLPVCDGNIFGSSQILKGIPAAESEDGKAAYEGMGIEEHFWAMAEPVYAKEEGKAYPAMEVKGCAMEEERGCPAMEESKEACGFEEEPAWAVS